MTSPNEMAGQGTYRTISTLGVGFAPTRTPAKQLSLVERLELKPRDLRDPFLRTAQKRWDSIYFDKHYTRESNGTSFVDAKTSHIGEHIAKALKKVRLLAAEPENVFFIEAVRNEALPDSAIYRTQLANTLGYNIRMGLGSATNKSSDLQVAKDYLIDALPQHYTEPQEHQSRDASLRSLVRNEGIPALHMAHLVLCNYFDIEPQQAHLDRLTLPSEIISVS